MVWAQAPLDAPQEAQRAVQRDARQDVRQDTQQDAPKERASKADRTTAASGENAFLVVQPGQTVYGISREYSIPIQALLDANPQIQGFALNIGDTLQLPQQGAAAALTETASPAPAVVEASSMPEAGEVPSAPKLALSSAGSEASTDGFLEAQAAESQPAETQAVESQPADSRPAYSQPKNAPAAAAAEPPARWHVLEAGETLFALAARFQVPLSELLALNPGLDHRALEAGQRIRIPLDEAAAAPERPSEDSALDQVSSTAAPATQRPSPFTTSLEDTTEKALDATAWDAGLRRTHRVAAGETWYGIARQYGLAVEALQGANPALNSGLKPGVVLVLPAEKPSASAPGDPSAEGKATVPAAASKAALPRPSIPTDWLRERGLATYLSDASPAPSPGTAEALALHDSAPVGTHIMVRNLMNNRSVRARVVGPLPNTAAQNRTVVTLSPEAAKALGAHDPRVLVEVAWPPVGEGASAP